MYAKWRNNLHCARAGTLRCLKSNSSSCRTLCTLKYINSFWHLSFSHQTGVFGFWKAKGSLSIVQRANQFGVTLTLGLGDGSAFPHSSLAENISLKPASIYRSLLIRFEGGRDAPDRLPTHHLGTLVAHTSGAI